jgi:thymidine kinase
MTSSTNESDGYLELFIGPMFSGKTTQLIQIYKTYKYIGKNIAVINYMDDVRYDNTQLSSHDKIMIPCIFAENIGSIWNDSRHKFYDDLHNADVILINEGQFFEDLFKTVLEMVEVKHKKVYICGLDGDFLRNKFGQLTDLIPYCDKVTKLQSLCSVCKNGKKAIFSHRITHETSQIVIGADNYMPLCRNCYYVMNK